MEIALELRIRRKFYEKIENSFRLIFGYFELENADFAYAPMKIITAEREFVDDINLDVDETHKLRGLCSFYAEKGGLLVVFEKN